MLPYTIEEIRQRGTPVAEKYRLAAVWVFGSYARGKADADSDVDLLVDLRGADIHGLDYGGLYHDLEQALEQELDMVDLIALEEPTDRRGLLRFRDAVKRERIMIYGAA